MAYPISEIQGIGTDVAAVLKSDGIRTTVSLLRVAKTPKQRLKIALKTGAPEKSVLDWVTAADRMRVKGVGWEYAELLRAAGVRTVNELRYRNPQKLAELSDPRIEASREEVAKSLEGQLASGTGVCVTPGS